MINQSIINNDTRVSRLVGNPVDSGVVVSIYDPSNVKVVADQSATLNPEIENQYYYDIDKTIVSTLRTFTIEWIYTSDGEDKLEISKLEILNDSIIRYCYSEDVIYKLFDIILPSSFDISKYTKRASNEINRALQGLYLLPLAPNSSHANYEQDFISLQELCSDIAAGYAIEDISISRSAEIEYNKKKAAAFAELKRYVDMTKVFSSISKDTTHDDKAYQNDKPRVAASEYKDKYGKQYSDPFNQVYNNFSPRSDRV